MKIYEIGTGYTSIPAKMGAATEIVVEELTKAFSAAGCDVSLIDIRDPARTPNDLSIIEVPMPFVFAKTDVALGIMHKLKRIAYSVSLTQKLRQIIRRSADKTILHFHNQYNCYFFLKLTPAALRKKVAVVYTVHSYIWPKAWPEIEQTIRKRYFQEVFCVQNTDRILVLNDKTREHFVAHLGVKAEKIHKIKNGVNPSIYRPLSKEENEAFKSSQNLGGKQYIFQVGSVCARKNQLGAVTMLTKYLNNHRDALYLFAGGIIEQIYFDEIMTYAKANGITDQVLYVGEVAPGTLLNQYYSAANVMLFPSKLESFGMVIIESLAAGTSVIVTEKPLFDLDNDITVCGNQEQFDEAVELLMKKKVCADRGRQEAVAKYGWTAVAEEHRLIYSRDT